MRPVTVALLAAVLSMPGRSQEQAYPKGFFMYPLSLPPQLNANFGEMRPNHFHMGLDLNTRASENHRLVAAADGYVGRVKIEAGGFGNAVYLYHPNGLTTLYAHMNGFFPELERYVKARQYEQQRWDLNLEIPAGTLPVKKGQFIGLSGNTGASQGPHVHFEVRRTADDKCLNPLLFGFPLPDNVPPDLSRLAVYDRNLSLYEQSPGFHALSRKGGFYQPPGVIRVSTDFVTLGIQATDRMSGFPNPNGIYGAQLSENGRPLSGFRLDGVGYEETRYLNAHIDYRHQVASGGYFQLLFPLKGNRLPIYATATGEAGIRLPDTSVRHFRLVVSDAYGNRSEARFSLQRTSTVLRGATPPGQPMFPGQTNIHETESLQLVLPEDALYDSIHFTARKTASADPKAYSPQHHLHNTRTPVHAPFTLRLKPERPVPYHLRDRMLVRRTTEKGTQVRKASWELGWYAAAFRDFGSFQLVTDVDPPTIAFVNLKEGGDASRLPAITITVADDNKSFHGFNATLDGRWIMFSQRGNTFTYRMDEHCPPGNHTLVAGVMDEAGNETTRTIRFTR